MSEFERLLVAMEDVAEKSLLYSRIASLSSKLGFILFVLAALATVVYVLSYGAYWQLITVNIALTVAMFVVDKLSDYFYHKALKEVDRLETLAIVTALSAEFTDQAKEMLKKKVEELKRGS